ncbi:MAG: cytochrome c3 family protein [Syntrophothermus sp.]
MRKQLFPSIFYNTMSLIGAVVAIISFGLIIFLIVLEAMTPEPKPYMGIVAFVILPGFLIIGLILIAIGAFRERKHVRKEIHLPIIDLNEPKIRRSVIFFSVGTIFLLLFTAFGSFKAYEYTDSDEFCGQICHKVMEPEYTAYLDSPHSRVGCVQCHIGSGTDWYVRSKISGAYQVYSVLFNKYSRPIPTPIENLRPAQGTCEQCHWPSHFYNQKKVEYNYFLSDENNTQYKTTVLLKIGGGNAQSLDTTGIHWHMNINNKITYFAEDEKRENITWIKAVNKTSGRETVYTLKGSKGPKNFSEDKTRLMDCIDCHNRPSHIYYNPAVVINQLMSNGKIDTTIPYIKSISIEALENKYSVKEKALDSISIIINDFYRTNYSDRYNSLKPKLDRIIEEVKKVYSRNYFPEMNVSWRYFPNNKGHMYSIGCFRCHDGNHVSNEGKTISSDCNACHVIIEQKFPGQPPKVNLAGLPFVHPADNAIDIRNQLCTDCHGPR